MAHKKTAIGVGVGAILFILLVFGIFSFLTADGEEFPPYPDAEEQAIHEQAQSSEREVDASELTEGQNDLVDINLEAALTERVIGNPDAPIKISEHSSLTCGHCANFHNKVFKEFKTNWIDSGKAYLVFSDFPLNAPALRASMAARCVKDDAQYQALIEELFTTQEDWAYESDYLTPLKAILAKFGIESDIFKACIQNKELEAGLLDSVRAAQQQYGINSTPSFVINNAVTISGGTSYEKFNEALEAAVVESNAPAEEAP